MHVELRHFDMGMRKVKTSVSPADFGVTDVRYFVSTDAGYVEATQNNYEPGKPLWEQVQVDQEELWIDGKRWGYVSKQDHRTIMLTRHVSPEVKAEVQAAVAKVIGRESKLSMPIDLSKLNPPEDEDESEDE